MTTLALALRGRRARGRALVGALTGVVHYGTALVFVTDSSAPGYVVLVLVESAALGVACVACVAVPAATSGRWSGGWWSVPAALVVLEAVQARAPFEGFPLAALSLSQVDGPLAAAAPVGGQLLITALTAATGTVLAAVLLPDRRRRVAPAGAALLAVVAVTASGTLVTTAPAGALDAAVVQGGGPRGISAVYTDPSDVTERHLDLARSIGGSPDLVLLPENVIDVEDAIAGSPADAEVAELAVRLGSPVVAGVTERTERTFRNAALLWDDTGARVARYEKEHRVPFGEYLPARALVERLSDAAALVPRDAVPGEGEAVLVAPGSGAPPLGVVISYEVFFADRVREAVRGGGQVVLVPTNASSYVGEQVPALQVATARLRARETGRALLQAGPTGYSAVILPDGRVTALSVLEQPAVLREQVLLRTGQTPYTTLGDVPLVAFALLTLGGAGLVPQVRRRPAGAIPAQERPAA